MKRNAISQWELSDHFWAESDPPEPCATAARGFLRRCARRLDRLTADKRVKYRLRNDRPDGRRRRARSADRVGRGFCCGGGDVADSGDGRPGTTAGSAATVVVCDDCFDDEVRRTVATAKSDATAAVAADDTFEADQYREASIVKRSRRGGIEPKRLNVQVFFFF